MKKQSLNVGDGANAIQLIGDGNTVVMQVGGVRFAHSQLHKRKATPENVNELLRTDLRGTSLVGRGGERAMLSAWRASARTISVRCIIGGAGAGKTRLAIEACEDAENDGWFATFASSGELKRFHDTQNLVHWKFPKDALIVIDYAATSQAVLLAWFAALAPHRQSGGKKLRLLLLERHASPEAGWWKDLTQAHSLDHDSAADLIDEKQPFTLPTLNAANDRRELLAEAMEKAASFAQIRRPEKLPSPGTDPTFDTLLAETRPENEPLYLIMAGIYAAEHGAPAALALNKLELAHKIAGIEKDRLAKFAHGQGFNQTDPLPAHIVACVTLQNGCARDELSRLIEQEREALKLPATLGGGQIAKILCNYLPTDKTDVAPVRPDLIGESLFLSVIEGDGFASATEQAAIVLRAWRRKPEGVLDALIRCARDFAQGDASHTSIRWLRAVMEQSDDLAELLRIADGIPHQTLALREFATDVEIRIANVVAPLAEENPDNFLAMLSRVLNNLSIRLSDLGRREEALDAAEEAVALFRQLARANSDAFTPNLAASLNNLALRLSALGRREDALAAAEEAVALRRQLAAARPDIFTPDLGGSLNNLAHCLSNVERREQALAVAEEAVSLYRKLPDTFTPNLAMSLNTLSSRLSALGRRQAALDAAEETVALRRHLAAARPDAFTPLLAGSLNNLANRLRALGQRGEALATAEEAVSLYSNLAKARPDAFTPDLVKSLSVLGDLMEADERVAEAVTLDHQTVSLLAPYCFASPAAFGENMMVYLGDYVRRAAAAGVGVDQALVSKISTVLRDAGLFGDRK